MNSARSKIARLCVIHLEVSGFLKEMETWCYYWEEERKKHEQLEKILEENKRKIEEAQKKLAEERLAIIEDQRKIDEEKRRLLMEKEKKMKEEQQIILNKGKVRPKLSFSLKPVG